jgi:hypothetical protein
MKMDKILESALLLEDDQEEEEEEGEFEEAEEEDQEQSEISVERVGPNGEIYAQSSSEEEFIEDENGKVIIKEPFISYRHTHAYALTDNKNIKTRKNNPNKLTKGTDPRYKDILNFIIDSTISSPMYLPMLKSDIKITNVTMEAALALPHMPLSEIAKKEFFYKCF